MIVMTVIVMIQSRYKLEGIVFHTDDISFERDSIEFQDSIL